MSWDDAVESTQSEFISWSDGPVVMRFVSEPLKERKHFTANGVEHCTGEGCRNCDDGPPDESFLFQIETEQGAQRRINLSKRAMKTLLEVRRLVGEDKFQSQFFHCSRRGAGKTIKYEFRPERISVKETDIPF